MENKKYKLRKDLVIEYGYYTLYRIEALNDFSNVKKGDLGGFIESEDNLSQEGDCWVYDKAKVFGKAKVNGYAEVYDEAQLQWKARIHEYAKVYGRAEIKDNAVIGGSAKVYGQAEIGGNVEVDDNAEVYKYARIEGNVVVYGNSKVYGNAYIDGEAKIKGNAIIKSYKDYYVGKNVWSSGRFFTYTRSNKMWAVGCFYGTSKELIEKAYKDSELSGRNYERVVKYVEEMYKDIENTHH